MYDSKELYACKVVSDVRVGGDCAVERKNNAPHRCQHHQLKYATIVFFVVDKCLLRNSYIGRSSLSLPLILLVIHLGPAKTLQRERSERFRTL